MPYTLTITDQQLVTLLLAYPEADRERVAQAALTIGLHALSHASGTLDGTHLQHAAEHAVRDAVQQVNATVQQQFSHDYPDSALTRVVAAATAHYEHLSREHAAHIQQLRDDLIASRATTTAHKATPKAGQAFEDALGEQLRGIATQAGDHADSTGTTEGTQLNRKVGDFVLTLGDQSHAPGVRIAVEAKHSKGYSISKIHAECALARRNRDAQVALFVYDHTLGTERGFPPLQRAGHDVVVLWSKDDPATDLYLTAGYWLARSLCAPATPRSTGIAVDWLAVVDTHLQQIDDLNKHLDSIKKLSDEVGQKSKKLAGEVEAAGTLLTQQVRQLQQQVQQERTAMRQQRQAGRGGGRRRWVARR